MSGVDDQRLAESSPELVALLRDEIAGGGRITFARFMELALTHPEHGYYMHEGSPAGFGGDFLTGPETHPIFGHTLARQVSECWDRLGQPVPFVVREEGAGSGTLARDIIDGLRHERPDLLPALRYELADANSERVNQAISRLEASGAAGLVDAADDTPFTGVLLANELLDAFPVHRLIVLQDLVQELYVAWRDGWFAEEAGPLSIPDLAEPVRELALVEGQRLEVSPAAWNWARTLGTRIERGFAILIDYGYPTAELYDPHQRHAGTLRTYSQHLVAADPFRRVGRQDITAHVDFGSVAAAAVEGGMTELGLTSQAFFFAGLGIEELLVALQRTANSQIDYLNARETVLHLMEPHGLGRFRVLVLGKQVDVNPPLRGLSFVLR